MEENIWRRKIFSPRMTEEKKTWDVKGEKYLGKENIWRRKMFSPWRKLKPEMEKEKKYLENEN